MAVRAMRETWRDWMPHGSPEPDGLITRDELIARLARQDVIVSTFDIQNWQEAGVVPYGVRRWHHGAARILYPPWMVDVIHRLRFLQARKRKMRDIGPELRKQFANTKEPS